MANANEREILSEFIELYKDLPCLWDTSCEHYKDSNEKSQAWKLLVDNLKKIDSTANVATAKKKIDNLKSSYKRESKKVKDSLKRTGSAAREVHKPNLWYYDLLSFLDKKDELLQSGVDTIASDAELQQSEQNCRPKGSSDQIMNRKRQKLIDTAQKLLECNPEKSNPFCVYVGQQLEQVSTFQRYVAEKLIAEVIFLAKTENLNFDSKIVTLSKPSLQSPSSHVRSFSYSKDLKQSAHSSPPIQSPPSHVPSFSYSQDIKQSPYSSPPIQSPPPHVPSFSYSQQVIKQSPYSSPIQSPPPLYSQNVIIPSPYSSPSIQSPSSHSNASQL